MARAAKQATLQQQGGKGNLKRDPGRLANGKQSCAKAKGSKGC